MAKKKDLEFSKKQLLISKKLKALGHPARVGIVEHLLKVKKCDCNDILKTLPLSQPSVSQHVKALRKTEIVSCEREGLHLFCSLNPKALKDIEVYFKNMNSNIN